MTKSSFGLIAPPANVWAVTPSDSADLAMETRAVYIGGTGDLAVSAYDPATNKLATVVVSALPVGTVLPIRTKRILSTGTTATDIVAMA